MITLGHDFVTTLDLFSRRLVEMFDRNDSKTHFRELKLVKQEGKVEDYVAKFQRLTMMIMISGVL